MKEESQNIILPVRLRFADLCADVCLNKRSEASRECTGVWLETDDRSGWLHWIAANCESHDAVEIYPFFTNKSYSGVLIANIKFIDGGQQRTANRFVCQHAILRLQSIFPGIWIPHDGRLDPMPDTTDWISFSEEDKVHFWHPSHGFVSIPQREKLSITDLFSLPQIVEGEWFAGVEESSLPERLISVSGPPISDMNEWLDNTASGIGEKSHEMDKLVPPKRLLGGKPLGKAKKIAGAAVGLTAIGAANLLAKSMKVLAKIFSANSSLSARPGRQVNQNSSTKKAATDSEWMKSIREWVNRQMHSFDEMMEANRNASLHRLISLLDKNPDEGLQYAIPLSDSDAARGLASPGWDLVRRSLDFGRREGPGAADPWNIESKTREKLLEKYRQLALRERQLGRFGRAAYIYAKLLGDYYSAATVLEQGKLFREAAVVYRDRLNNPANAAKCFRAAGDFNEAIRIYRSMGELIAAGDLLKELGQTEEAEREYRHYVQDCLQTHDFIAAADCLVDKMDCVDEALSILRTQWPKGNFGERCFRKTLDILDSQGRYAEAITDMDRLMECEQAVLNYEWPIAAFLQISCSSADETVRHHAQDGVFVMANAVLKLRDRPNVDYVIKALQQVRKDDHAFHRDTIRYQQHLKAKQAPKKSIRIANHQSNAGIRSIHEWKLDRDTEWFHVAPTSGGVLVVGLRNEWIIVEQIARNFENVDGRETKYFYSLSHESVEDYWVKTFREDVEGEELISIVLGGGASQNHFDLVEHQKVLGHLSKVALLRANSRVWDFIGREGFSLGPKRLTNTTVPAKELFAEYLCYENEEATIRKLTSLFANSYALSLDQFFDERAESSESSFDSESDWQPDEDTVEFIPQYKLPEWRFVKHRGLTGVFKDRELRVINGTDIHFKLTLPRTIQDVSASMVHVRPRFLISMERGVTVQWLQSDDWLTQVVSPQVNLPKAIFTRDSGIIIGHENGIEIHSNRLAETKLVKEQFTKSPIQSICLDDVPRQFWSLDQDGILKLWEC